MQAALKPRKKPLQARSAVTVDAIVEATIRILRRDGWAACTTTRIATLAGVSVGSLYQYFPNRNAITAFVTEKRKGLDVSLALRESLPEVQGRQAIIEEGRRFVPALRAKLAAAGAGPADTADLAVALAAVEGAVWEMMAQDEGAMRRPEAIDALSRVFRAAAGLSPAAGAR